MDALHPMEVMIPLGSLVSTLVCCRASEYTAQIQAPVSRAICIIRGYYKWRHRLS